MDRTRRRLLVAVVLLAGAGGACTVFDGLTAETASNGEDASADGTTTGDAAGLDGTSPDDGPLADAGLDAAPICTATPCVVQISAVGEYVCARLVDRTVRCWGRNTSGQLGVGLNAAGAFDAAQVPVPTEVPGVLADEIATGSYSRYEATTCVRTGSSVACWGNDTHRQLGRPGGDAAAQGAYANLDAAVVQGITNAVEIGIGSDHACARTATGSISCWGGNECFELGRPTPQNLDPVPGPWVLDAAATQLTVGRIHSCALLASGQVACWGCADRGALGSSIDGGSIVPVLVPGLTDVVEVVAGSSDHTCARTSNGSVLCWGRNLFGQLGRTPGADDPVPGIVPLPEKAKHVALGGEHTCAILADDSVYCWGRNTVKGKGSNNFAGQIGRSPTGADDLLTGTPRRILGITGKPLRLALGYAHSCVLIEGGSVMCWGTNRNAELGHPTVKIDAGNVDGGYSEDPQPVPTRVVF